MNTTAKDILKEYISRHLFKTFTDPKDKGGIKLSSGKLSKYYFDIRSVSSTWYFSRLIAYCYEDIIKPFEKEKVIKVGGLETGAIPIIMSIVHEYQLDGFYVRKKPKKYGLKQQIEGILSDKVILVDDIVTTGKSILECIDAIHKSKHDTKIIGVYPLVDRNKELENFDLFFQLRSKGIEYKPIFSSLEFIQRQEQQ